MIRSKFSVTCVKKYDKLKLNYPDIRPSHVKLREPNYKKITGSIIWISRLGPYICDNSIVLSEGEWTLAKHRYGVGQKKHKGAEEIIQECSRVQENNTDRKLSR